MYDIVRFKDGTCRVFSDKNGDPNGDYEILRRFSELKEAENFLITIRDFLILKTEEGKNIIIFSRERKDYPDCTIQVGLTTSSIAQIVLEKMNTEKA